MINTWKNAGTPWWRKSWEAAWDHVHAYAWTQKGAKRKMKRVHDKVRGSK